MGSYICGRVYLWNRVMRVQGQAATRAQGRAGLGTLSVSRCRMDSNCSSRSSASPVEEMFSKLVFTKACTHQQLQSWSGALRAALPHRPDVVLLDSFGTPWTDACLTLHTPVLIPFQVLASRRPGHQEDTCAFPSPAE